MIAQLPRFCLSRRCPYNAGAFKFLLCRPQWAEARRTQGLVFGAAGRKYQILRRASFVSGGPGGKMTVSARSAKALTGIGPRRIFGYFLCEQKVTLFRIYKKGNV